MNVIVKKKSFMYTVHSILLFFDMKEPLVNSHCIDFILFRYRHTSDNNFIFDSSYRSSGPSEK